MSTIRRLLLGAGAAFFFAAAVGEAGAHAFGERYELPLPLGMFLAGAAAAVAGSFVVAGLFAQDSSWPRHYPRLRLLDYRLGRLAQHSAIVFALKLATVGLFALVLATGFFGNQNPQQNLAPVLVWIIGWVGMAMVSAFLGDLWAVINPWRNIFVAYEALWRRWRPGRATSFGLPYAEAVGVWPAVALLLALTWLELVSNYPASPAHVAAIVLVYSLLTWTGMVLFGRERWLSHGEVFGVVFGVLARFAPTGSGTREWTLRPFAVGLLNDGPASASMVALVLLYLVSVMFDGLLVTPAWGWLEARIVPQIPALAESSRMAARTAGLLGAWLLGAALYLIACQTMAALAGRRAGLSEVARQFVMTLVPIVIAYHLAHYLGYLLIQGQYVIPLASDPFGWGWDLFGTAGYRVDVGIFGARLAWYVTVAAIVAGHVIAVFLGHARAVAVFGTRPRMLWSQGPLTVLMVCFTVASLSILAQSIVQEAPSAEVAGGGAAAVSVPADALLPEPGSGRLLPVGPGKNAAVGLTYGAMTSRSHDGTPMTAADLLYAVAFAYRWSPQDPAIDAATAVLRRALKGVKYIGVDPNSQSIRFGDLTYARERLLVNVYLDAPATDGDFSAALAPPWTSLPWHAIALMEEAVVRGWAAFSKDEAARRGVEWLDPVRSAPLKRRLEPLVEEFERAGYIPAALAGLVTPAEARARWTALRQHHAKYGHYLVTNGPYVVKGWEGGAAVLEVVREADYPLGVGSYDSYAIPRRAIVVKADPAAEGLALAVEVDVVDRIMRDFRIVRRPLKDAVADLGPRAVPDCRFTVVDDNGGVVLAGTGRYRVDGAIVLDLKDRLASGRYTVFAALYPYGNTVNAEIRRIPYAAP